MQLILGSRNAHKLRELSQLLQPHELVPLPDAIELPPENGATFSANAIEKALASARATGTPALGEDSGITVAALQGGPGVRSARYAGEQASDEQNLEKLLRETQDAGDRSAAYVCALAFAAPGGDVQLFEGRCEGRLARAPRGSGGFGYDPIFLPLDGPSPDTTMAELEPARKNAISHRGRAAALLREWLATAAP
jgi:XTP/dITP diphosphohydrolase